jgi:hypothetical protein
MSDSGTYRYTLFLSVVIVCLSLAGIAMSMVSEGDPDTSPAQASAVGGTADSGEDGTVSDTDEIDFDRVGLSALEGQGEGNVGDGEVEWSWDRHVMLRAFDASRTPDTDPPVAEKNYAPVLDRYHGVGNNTLKNITGDLTFAYQTTDPELQFQVPVNATDVDAPPDEVEEYNGEEVVWQHRKVSLNNVYIQGIRSYVWDHSGAEDTSNVIGDVDDLKSGDYVQDAYVSLFPVPGAAEFDSEHPHAPDDILYPRESHIPAGGDFWVDYQEERICRVSGNTKICIEEELLDHDMKSLKIGTVTSDSNESDSWSYKSKYFAAPRYSFLQSDGVANSTGDPIEFEAEATAWAKIKRTTETYTREDEDSPWKLQSREEEIIEDEVDVEDSTVGHLPGDLVIADIEVTRGPINKGGLNSRYVSGQPEDKQERFERTVFTTDSTLQPQHGLNDSVSSVLWSRINMDQGGALRSPLAAYSVARDTKVVRVDEGGRSEISEEEEHRLVTPKYYLTPIYAQVQDILNDGTKVTRNEISLTGGNHTATYESGPFATPNTTVSHSSWYITETTEKLEGGVDMFGDPIPTNTTEMPMHGSLLNINQYQVGGEDLLIVHHQSIPWDDSGRFPWPVKTRQLSVEGGNESSLSTNGYGNATFTREENLVEVRFDGYSIRKDGFRRNETAVFWLREQWVCGTNVNVTTTNSSAKSETCDFYAPAQATVNTQTGLELFATRHVTPYIPTLLGLAFVGGVYWVVARVRP